MGLFSKPEVIILKESCDSKEYLDTLQELRKTVSDNTEAAEKIDKEIAITEAGIFGEDKILFELKSSGMDLVVIRDLFLKIGDDRSAQIDYFVITPHGVVIIECKNLFGNIEINNKGDFIRSFDYKGRWYKEGIYSPITQNERHLAIYKECWMARRNVVAQLLFNKYFDENHKTIVVLANPKTVVNDKWAKKEVKNQVIRCDQLINYLRNMNGTASLSKKEMLDIGEAVCALNVDVRTDYLKKFKELVETTKAQQHTTNEDIKTQTEQKLICPKCGGLMISKQDGKRCNDCNYEME